MLSFCLFAVSETPAVLNEAQRILPTVGERVVGEDAPGRQLRGRKGWLRKMISKDGAAADAATGDGAPAMAEVCDDSCVGFANNGRCDDGRQAMALRETRKAHRISCALGTDCTDCGRKLGPRQPAATLAQMMPATELPAGAVATSPTEPLPSVGPSGVELLRQRKVELNAAWTRTQPSFLMPFTDPSADIDVSRNMQAMRAVEPLYNLYWHRLSQQCCANGGERHGLSLFLSLTRLSRRSPLSRLSLRERMPPAHLAGLMLDVGANFGYYSLYAAKLGCRVVAWEPIPVFRAFVEEGLALNNLSHRVHLRSNIVSGVGGQTISMTVPEKGIWGTASVGGLNVDPSIPSPTYKIEARTETLDQVVTEQPCIMKLDVEGYEPSVLKGAVQMLAKFPPMAILTE